MAELGNDFKIKVSTEMLRQKSEVVSGLLEELREQFEDINTRINRTSFYWEGDGGTKRRNEYSKEQKTVERMLQRLREYPEDLLVMAGVYDDAESNNRQYTEQLSSDVIV